MLTIRAIDSRAGKGNMLLESELFYEQPRRGAGMECKGNMLLESELFYEQLCRGAGMECKGS